MKKGKGRVARGRERERKWGIGTERETEKERVKAKKDKQGDMEYREGSTQGLGKLVEYVGKGIQKDKVLSWVF